MSETDPWTVVLDKLWGILEDDHDFDVLVPEGNRIKYTNPEETDSEKTEATTADYPEVKIKPTVSQDAFKVSSKSLSCKQSWNITVSTGRMCVCEGGESQAGNVGVFQLIWVILKALFAAGDNLGLTYVNGTKITTVMLNDFDPNESRGTRGWTMTVNVTTVLELPRTGRDIQLPKTEEEGA